MCCMQLAGNTGCKKSPSGHHRTTLSGWIFATKACIDNPKKAFQKAISPPDVPTICQTSGPLAAEIVYQFEALHQISAVSRVGFITAATSLNGGQPNFARCLAISLAGTVHIHFWGLLPRNGILIGAKFTLRPGLALSYISALLHGTRVVGISQTLRHWAEGATYIWQGGHHVGHQPTFLVLLRFSFHNSSVTIELTA